MTPDLSNHIARMQLVARIQADVNTFCQREFFEDPRTHLGASIIGHPCTAYAWNVFRWLRFEVFSGTQLRLFNRGHTEEARFVRWLTGIGFIVSEINPETGKQYRIIGAKGHFGGSLDGLAIAPERYGLGDEVLLIEFKTHSEKNFTKLAGPKPAWRDLQAGKLRTGGEGVARSKPMHVRQMNSYGRAYGLKYGLYCAVNKDTDELYFEIVPLDYLQADDLFRKAEGVVFAREQPTKIAHTDAFHECKICDFAGICHRGEVPTKNCRSCRHAVPIEDAKWWCELYSASNGPLPDHIIPVGCDSYARIK
jgi:hypothetical protein